jgi:hypothetical protein
MSVERTKDVVLERTSVVRRPNRPRTNTAHAHYRLGRAALDQRQFLATELAALTGVPINTVYGFIANLGGRITSEALAPASVGRPRNLYTLTDEGVDYLLDRNLEIAQILRRGSTAESGVDAEQPIAAMGTLLNELRDIFVAEKQYAQTLPKLTKVATPSELKANITAHFEQAKAHIDRLERVYYSIDRKTRGKPRDKAAGAVEKQESALE